MNAEIERPNPLSYWVKPGELLAGPYPGARSEERAREKLQRFRAAGITSFVDLTEEGEMPAYRPLLMGWAGHSRMSIPDFDVVPEEEMRRILDLIDRQLFKGETVYVHCLGGQGRTGTVVGCYLVRHGMSGREALERVRALRQVTPFPKSPSPETQAQRRMVLGWKEGQ
jgi:hypothetical protein